MAPVHTARLRVETDDALGCPRDQNARIALRNHNRGGVRCFVIKGLPFLGSRFSVESDDARAGRSANLDDHVRAFNDGRAGDTPRWHRNIVFGVQVSIPLQFARRRIEAVEMSHRPEGVSEAVMHGNRRAGTRNVADSVLAIVRVGPDQFARFPCETLDPFNLFRFRKPVSNVYAPVHDTRAAVAAADGHSPADRDVRPVELFDNPGFTPYAVPLRSAPLRPFVG